jgi:hypothetical protein
MREKLDFSTASIKFTLDKVYTIYRLLSLYQLHGRTQNNYFGTRFQRYRIVLGKITFMYWKHWTVLSKKKIISVSNENPWGIMRFLEESK